MPWLEEDLIATLSDVLLKEEIEGLDDDLVAYISGLLSTQLDSNSDSCEEILEESMVPFLESVGCPEIFVEEAKTAIISQAKEAATAADAAPTNEARKLKQGIVNMSSDLTTTSDEESNTFLWGKEDGVKANANTQIDAYQVKTSSKDRRKQRQELEKTRQDLAQTQQLEQSSTKAGVSAMVLPTVKSKEKDVLMQVS